MNIDNIPGRTNSGSIISRKAILGGTLFHVALIALLGVAVYSNTFHVPFLFDDHESIVENPVIKNLSNFLFKSGGYSYNPRRFIGYLTVALNYRLGGLDVTGYHIFNLAVHIANACLVYALVRLTLRTPFFGDREAGTGNREPEPSVLRIPNPGFLSLFAALLFVSHPIQTQAVTYIIQRLASLATMFYLLALVLYVKARLAAHDQTQASSHQSAVTGRRSRAMVPLFFYLGALIAALLAMKTKEIAFTLPFIVVLYEFSFFKSTLRKKLPILLPVALTLLIIPLGLLQADKPLGELLSDMGEKLRVQTNISRWDYLFTQFRVIVTYIRLLFFPANQNLDYDYPVYHSFFTPPVLLSFLFLAALFGLAIWCLYRSGLGTRDSGSGTREAGFGNREAGTFRIASPESRIPNPEFRLIAFGILWFFITLSVESSVIPIIDVIFEHRMYLPSVGAFIAISAGMATLLNRYPPQVRTTCVVVIIALLSAAAWKRNLIWRDAATFWADVVRKSPGKERPHDNLGYALLYDKQRVDEAIVEYQTALSINPAYVTSRHGLGVAYMKKGLVDRAIEQFHTAIKLKPDMSTSHYNLAQAFSEKGMLDDAIAHYRTALKLGPDTATGHYNLAHAYYRKGMIDQSIEQFQTALKMKPDMISAHYNLGIIYGERGMTGKAIEHFQSALSLKPDLETAHYYIAVNYSRSGRLDRAIEHFQAAARLKPDNPVFHDGLAGAYEAKGLADLAREERGKAGGMRKAE